MQNVPREAIKLPFVIKIFDLSIFEWPFYTGFTVLVFQAGIHKMLVRIANREDRDQKQSYLDVCCVPRP